MNDSFEVKAAGPSDVEGAARLHVTLFSGIGETRDSFDNILERDALYVAVEKGAGFHQIVGYVTLMQKSPGHYLSWYGVDPRSRKKGVGQALLLHALGEAQRLGAEAVMLDSRNRFVEAMRLYLKCGFLICGTYLAQDGDLMIRLRKTLRPM